MDQVLSGVQRMLAISLAQLDALSGNVDWARAIHRDTWSEPYEGATDPQTNAEQIAKAMAKSGVPRDVWEARIDELRGSCSLLDQVEKILRFIIHAPELQPLLIEEWIVLPHEEEAHRTIGTFWAWFCTLTPEQRKHLRHDIEGLLVPGRGLYLGRESEKRSTFHPVQAQP